jgi:hypothetical protein
MYVLQIYVKKDVKFVVVFNVLLIVNMANYNSISITIYLYQMVLFGN